jgi:hypothetical protein
MPSPESISPSQTAIQLGTRQRSPVVTEDIERDMDLQSAQSIIAQRCVPSFILVCGAPGEFA